MVAVDTNIIIRLAIRDDEAQYQKAITLLKLQPFFITRTVQLEVEWVLRSRYKRLTTEIADFFTLMLQKKQIVCENEQALLKAIECYRLGADFADALHLANLLDLPFYTFDARFCKKAIAEGLISPVNFL